MKTLEEFYRRVGNAKKRLGISRRPAWFRGHRVGSYRLLPSIMRRRDGLRHERNLFANFKTQSARHLDDIDSWELLAIMQHHGMPTRLLDWTESVHTALFFALEGKIESPCIWILNPFKLNQKAAARNVVFDRADKIGVDYYEAIQREAGWLYEYPIAMDAPWRNDRIANQRGSFTFHGKNQTPLEETCADCVKCVPIPPHLVRPLRAELERSGFDYFRLFPDLDGLSRSLKVRFKF